MSLNYTAQQKKIMVPSIHDSIPTDFGLRKRNMAMENFY